jgi:hypothetical protein
MLGRYSFSRQLLKRRPVDDTQVAILEHHELYVTDCRLKLAAFADHRHSEVA